MPKIKCAAVECKYNSNNNYCTADKTVMLTAHSVMTVWDGRQQFWRCKNFAMSDKYREIEERFDAWMKKRSLSEENYRISECTRHNLCVDCDNIHCAFMGKASADCPKYNCDMGRDMFMDCDHCSFMKTYQKEMREMYAKEIQN